MKKVYIIALILLLAASCISIFFILNQDKSVSSFAESSYAEEIGNGKVGIFVVGGSLQALQRAFPEAKWKRVTLQAEDWKYPGVEFRFRQEKQVSFIAHLRDEGTEDVTILEVLNPQFISKAGLHVGSVLSELRKAYPKLNLKFSEGVYYVEIPDDPSMSFKLDVQPHMTDPFPSSVLEVPDDARIVAISIIEN